MLKHYSRELIGSVKEMLERRLDIFEIAHRMNLDPDDIQMMIEIIKQLVS